MDVFDSYFRTLRLFLPRDQRDDIIRELSEEVRSQASEREAELGRPLTEDEQTAIVGQYGHPLLTAARYWPQRHLIGPVLFPYYWAVLKVVLAIIATAHLAGAAVMIADGAAIGDLTSVLEDAIATALKAIGWITVLAAGADFWLARSGVLEHWRPRAGFPHELARQTVSSALACVPGSRDRASRTKGGSTRAADPSLTGFVISVVVGVWWLAGLKVPALFFGPGATNLDWGPAMDRLYPILVVAQVTMLVEQFVRLTWTEDTRIIRVTSLVWLISGWALIALVATSDHQWMVWQGEGVAQGKAVLVQVAGRDVSLAQFVNYVWSTIFIAVAAGSAWGTFTKLRRRLRGTPSPAHA